MARPRGRHRSRRSSDQRTGVSLRIAVGLAALGLVGLALFLRGPGEAEPQLKPDQKAFVDEVGGVAQRLRHQVGLPPSLVVAMAINETGWGRSDLAKRARNYFGIKAVVGTGTAGFVLADTREFIDGRWVTVRAPFRAYDSLDESLLDLGAFLRSNERYAALQRGLDGPREAAQALATAGYASDPSWAKKLIELIDAYRLERLDIGWLS
jgi:flagellum-specific peptidoglycan hydrolase FlgJ